MDVIHSSYLFLLLTIKYNGSYVVNSRNYHENGIQLLYLKTHLKVVAEMHW